MDCLKVISVEVVSAECPVVITQQSNKTQWFSVNKLAKIYQRII